MTTTADTPKTPATVKPPSGSNGGGVRGWLSRQPTPVRWAVLGLAVVCAYLLPYLGKLPFVGPQVITEGVDWSTALFNMSYYVLLALGLNVVVGFAGLLDLGYVGFFAVGTYAVALLTSPDSDLGTNWRWLAALPIAIMATMVSGVI